MLMKPRVASCCRWPGCGLALLVLGAAAAAGPLLDRGELDRVNRCLHGVVVDHTFNHGSDNRIRSAALGEKRDLYVYLPPAFDPTHLYPLMIYLHGFGQDELYVLKNQIDWFDRAIACGQLPPMIIAIPDGSIQGRATLLNGASFFANSKAGRFEDYLMQDVWSFLHATYPVRPEREAHVLAGTSMGGSAVFHLGVKYRKCFKVLVGFFPAVNLRWVDCHQRYMADFDPRCWGWRTEPKPLEVVGVFLNGLYRVRYKHLIGPLFGIGPDSIAQVSAINPIELLQRYDLKEGELAMYIGYAGKDEFNIDAQVESYLYCARQRGLTIEVGYDPNGKHGLETGKKLFPQAAEWLGRQLAPALTPAEELAPPPRKAQ